MTSPKLRFPEFEREWEKAALSELIEDKPRNGFSPEPVDYKTNVKVLSISAVTTGVFKQECYKYTNYIPDDQGYYWVKNGDILIQRSNTADLVGSSAIYDGADDQYIYPDLLMRVHAKETVNSKYLSSYIAAPITRKYYRRSACGTSGNMPKINQKIVSDTPIYIPDKEEQDKIALFIDFVDKKIEKEELIVLDFEMERKSIIKNILNQNIRFKKNNEDYPCWKEFPLSELLQERKTKAIKDGNFEHVSLTKEGVVPKSSRYERDFLVKSNDKEYKVTQLNDICYNPANLKFGVICRNKYGEGIFSPIYVTFETTQFVLPEFIEICLTRFDFINYALKYQQGTVFERMAVSPEDLLKIKIQIPCLEEQQKIANFLSVIDRKIETERKILEDWKKLKRGLLQQMFV